MSGAGGMCTEHTRYFTAAPACMIVLCTLVKRHPLDYHLKKSEKNRGVSLNLIKICCIPCFLRYFYLLNWLFCVVQTVVRARAPTSQMKQESQKITMHTIRKANPNVKNLPKCPVPVILAVDSRGIPWYVPCRTHARYIHSL